MEKNYIKIKKKIKTKGIVIIKNFLRSFSIKNKNINNMINNTTDILFPAITTEKNRRLNNNKRKKIKFFLLK